MELGEGAKDAAHPQLIGKIDYRPGGRVLVPRKGKDAV